MKIKFLLKALKYQLPLKRMFKNFFITRNAWGMFYKSSHISRGSGKEKIGYTTFESAKKASDKMSEKHSKHFSTYYYIFCGKFNIGKNRHNKYDISSELYNNTINN